MSETEAVTMGLWDSFVNFLRKIGLWPKKRPKTTLVKGPHAFFGPSVWKAWSLDPDEAMKLLSDYGLAFKFEVFGDDPNRYDLDKAVAYCEKLVKAAERYGVLGCLTLNNGNDGYFEKGIGLDYFKPAIDKIFGFLNPKLVMVEPVSESSSGNHLHIAIENYAMSEWKTKKGGMMVWNRGSRPGNLPAGWDVLDFHVFNMDQRKAAPKVDRVIISADTTPMVYWLTGKSELGTKYVPDTVKGMVKTCLAEKFWGVDVYPANHDKCDEASMKAAGKAADEVLAE